MQLSAEFNWGGLRQQQIHSHAEDGCWGVKASTRYKGFVGNNRGFFLVYMLKTSEFRKTCHLIYTTNQIFYFTLKFIIIQPNNTNQTSITIIPKSLSLPYNPQSPYCQNCFYKFIVMTLKYRRSILFDQPEQTTAKIALQTLVYDYKQRLNINSRSSSAIHKSSPQRMTIAQAKVIEALQSKLKTISFHTLYKQYQKNTIQDQENNINPQKLEMFRSGKFYRCSQRPKKEELRLKCENTKNGMADYYDRKPEEEICTLRDVPTRAKLGTGRAKTFHSSRKI